jgi:hypothetical protein
MVVLVAMVGLAVDGGSMYNQRRVAQNGSDGASMAGARTMLGFYEEMIANTTVDQDDWPNAGEAAARESAVRQKIDQYLAANGVLTTTSEAYFVDQNKQIVTVANGNQCGPGLGHGPCQVGQNGVIPWTTTPARLGARGIMVKGVAETGTFFMGVLGWSKVSASANATAYMGVAVSSAYDIKLLPIGFFTETDKADSLRVGVNYTLISFNVFTDATTSGNWGWVNYKGSSPNANVLRAWIDCGFNPSITAQTWPQWCPEDANTNGAEGPLAYWTGWPKDNVTGPYDGLTVRFGAGIDGWWLAGTTGAKSSACHELDDVAEGAEYIVPVFDTHTDQGGSGALMHLYRLAKFRISDVDIRCNGQSQHFDIQGVFEETFAPGSSGWHGDIRHNSLHLIFMAP